MPVDQGLEGSLVAAIDIAFEELSIGRVADVLGRDSRAKIMQNPANRSDGHRDLSWSRFCLLLPAQADPHIVFFNFLEEAQVGLESEASF